jgi:hypothetical protein
MSVQREEADRNGATLFTSRLPIEHCRWDPAASKVRRLMTSMPPVLVFEVVTAWL